MLTVVTMLCVSDGEKKRAGEGAGEERAISQFSRSVVSDSL